MTTPIARWSTVPYQSVAGTFRVGVHAWAVEGIERVEFYDAWNDDDLGTVETPTVDLATGQWGYWLDVDVDGVSGDGEPMLCAGAWDWRGNVFDIFSVDDSVDGFGRLDLRRALTDREPAIAWVAPDGDDESGDGTRERPCKTARAAAMQACKRFGSGSFLYAPLTIYHEEGAYHLGDRGWPRASIPEHWVTVTAAPEADPAKVVIRSGNGVDGCRMVRFHRCVLNGDYDALRLTIPLLWLDRIVDAGPMEAPENPGANTHRFKWAWGSRVWCTGSRFRTFNGPSQAYSVQNCRVETVAKSPFAHCRHVVNSTVDRLDYGDQHGSCFKLLATDADPVIRNVIWQGNRASYPMQGIHLENNAGAEGRFEGIAIVDNLIRKNADNDGGCWFEGRIDSLLMDGNVINDQSIRWKCELGDALIRDNRFRDFTVNRIDRMPGVRLEGNTFADTSGYGSWSAGSGPRPLVVDPLDVTTTNTNPGDPGHGEPDGVVDGADLSAITEAWMEGAG